MSGFEHILDWKLQVGSHPFPGKHGGTCINEAAIVAAGFEYQPVRRVEEMPKCFSRPICRLAMRLNDDASDSERQALLPYVTRLACADSPEIERRREAYIASEMRYGVSITRGIEILEEALAIGRAADPLGPDEAAFRLAAVRQKARTTDSIADSPLFEKVKHWLGAKQLDPTN